MSLKRRNQLRNLFTLSQFERADKSDFLADHIVFLPSSSTLASEQLGDITPHDKVKNVLADIQAKGIKIACFQANQAEGGK